MFSDILHQVRDPQNAQKWQSQIFGKILLLAQNGPKMNFFSQLKIAPLDFFGILQSINWPRPLFLSLFFFAHWTVAFLVTKSPSGSESSSDFDSSEPEESSNELSASSAVYRLFLSILKNRWKDLRGNYEQCNQCKQIKSNTSLVLFCLFFLFSIDVCISKGFKLKSAIYNSILFTHVYTCMSHGRGSVTHASSKKMPLQSC